MHLFPPIKSQYSNSSLEMTPQKMDFTSLCQLFGPLATSSATQYSIVYYLHFERVLVSQFWFGVKIRFLKRAPLYTFRMREMATTTNMDDCQQMTICDFQDDDDDGSQREIYTDSTVHSVAIHTASEPSGRFDSMNQHF